MLKKITCLLLFVALVSSFTGGLFAEDQGEVTLNLNDYVKTLRNIWEREHQQPAVEYPVPYSIYSSTYSGRIDEYASTVRVVMKIEVFKPGWHSIPVTGTRAAIRNALLDGQEATFVTDGGMYNLITQKTGRHTLELDLLVPVENTNLVLPIARCPVTNVYFSMRKNNSRMVIANAKSIEYKEVGNRIEVSASLGSTEQLNVSIVRKIEEKEDATAVVSAEVDTLVSVGEGIIHCSSDIFYFIREAKIDKLTVMIPLNVDILNVIGNGVINYTTVDAEQHKLLSVELNSAIKGEYNLRLEYEKTLDKTSGTYDVPVIVMDQVSRQNGFIGVQAITNVEIKTADKKTLTTIDVKELPQVIWEKAEMPLLLGYKYLDNAALSLEFKRHSDIGLITSICESLSYSTVITRNGRSLTRALFTIRNTYDQYMKLKLPPESEVWSAMLSDKPVKLSEDEDGYLLLPLEKSDMDEENLKTFTIEIMYTTQLSEFSMFGELKNYLCETKFEVQRIEHEIYLPAKYRYRVGKATTLIEGIDEYTLQVNTRTNRLTKNKNIISLDELEIQQNNEPVTQFQSNYMDQDVEKEWSGNLRSDKGSINNYLKKGTVPVEINLPTTGIRMEFSKTLPEKEKQDLIHIKYLPPLIHLFIESSLKILLLTLFLAVFMQALYIVLGKARHYTNLPKKSSWIIGVLTVVAFILSFTSEINFVITGLIGSGLLAISLILLYEVSLYQIRNKKLDVDEFVVAKRIYGLSLLIFVIIQIFAARANVSFDMGSILIVFNLILYVCLAGLALVMFIIKIIKREMKK